MRSSAVHNNNNIYSLKLIGFGEAILLMLLLTLGACARGTVVVLCVSVIALAATYLFYTFKTRCH